MNFILIDMLPSQLTPGGHRHFGTRQSTSRRIAGVILVEGVKHLLTYFSLRAAPLKKAASNSTFQLVRQTNESTHSQCYISKRCQRRDIENHSFHNALSKHV
jgi:hypothetical protein